MNTDRLGALADNVVALQQAKKAGSKPRRLNFAFAGDIKPQTNGLYLVKGLIPSGLLAVFGHSNSGKTAVAGDMALHIAAGLEYRGRRTRQGLVVWAALEAPDSMANRMVGWISHHDIELGELRWAMLTGSLDLRHANSVKELLDVLYEIEAAAGERMALFVIDTLARAMPGANENSSEDMGAVISNLGRVLGEFSGASILLIHHTGKDDTRGLRGHSSLIAAVDGAFEVKDGEFITRKSRDSKVGEALAFQLMGRDIGVDEDGDAVTAVVAVPTDAPVGNKARSVLRLSAGSKTALRVLRELLREEGAGVAALDAPVGTIAIRFERWREMHRSRYGGEIVDSDTSGAERQAWKRALQQLQDAGIVTVSGEWVFANDKKKHA